ncbi:MAG: hypothetical protein RIQ93_129 [Verrucomicrobiota bacterium]|jgi:predicted anti-sigma-YlaC factor YlaD
MDCRQAQHQIFAERDGALDSIPRAELAAHLAQCDPCRALANDLTATVEAWRDSTAQVKAPDALVEWQKVRREIRGGVQASGRRRGAVAWLAWPVAAAAAIAGALFVASPFRDDSPSAPAGDVSRANPSPAAGAVESTVVFVDEKSGWVFVWAGDGSTHI